MMDRTTFFSSSSHEFQESHEVEENNRLAVLLYQPRIESLGYQDDEEDSRIFNSRLNDHAVSLRTRGPI